MYSKLSYEEKIIRNKLFNINKAFVDCSCKIILPTYLLY